MNTKIIKSLACLTLSLFMLSACGSLRVIPGSGNLKIKSIPISGFNHIVVGGVGELVIDQTGSESLSVETDDNLLQYVRAEVRGETLHLSLDVPGIRTAKPTLLRFTLGVNDLVSMEADGEWTIHSDSLVADSLEFILTGANKVDLASIKANDLAVRISGSAEIKLLGSITHQSIRFIGGGIYDAGNVSSEITSFQSDGTSQITVWATGNLTGTLTGSGSVFYYGAPQTTFTQSGTGNIQSLGGK
jgi:hypothetical protein